MSDRTPGSVRSASPAGDPAAANDSAQGAPAGLGDPGEPRHGHPASAGRGRAGAPRAAATSAPSTGSSAVGAAGAAAPAAAAATTSGDGRRRRADVGGGRRATTRGGSARGGRGPRRARLQLRHIDTWSALKISLVLSIALFFIWMVAVGILYMVLNALGVFQTLNDLFGQVG